VGYRLQLEGATASIGLQARATPGLAGANDDQPSAGGEAVGCSGFAAPALLRDAAIGTT
jgi:hypothetical protein